MFHESANLWYTQSCTVLVKYWLIHHCECLPTRNTKPLWWLVWLTKACTAVPHCGSHNSSSLSISSMAGSQVLSMFWSLPLQVAPVKRWCFHVYWNVKMHFGTEILKWLSGKYIICVCCLFWWRMRWVTARWYSHMVSHFTHLQDSLFCLASQSQTST